MYFKGYTDSICKRSTSKQEIKNSMDTHIYLSKISYKILQIYLNICFAPNETTSFEHY